MTDGHNTQAMLASPRCGARTRSGDPCRAPAAGGSRRCRMHGGAPDSGAPLGNRNAVIHGLATADAIAERRAIGSLLADAYGVLDRLAGTRTPEADQDGAEMPCRGATSSRPRDP